MTRARLVLLMLVLGSGAYLLARASHDDAPVASAQDRASALAAVRERVPVRPSPQLRSGRIAGVAVPPLRLPVIRRSRPTALATATPAAVPTATPTPAGQPWAAGPSGTTPTATAPAPAATYSAPAPAPAPRPTAAPTFDSSGSGPGFDSSG